MVWSRAVAWLSLVEAPKGISREAPDRSSAQSGAMAVEVACLGNILRLLRRHFCSIQTARHTARPEFYAGALSSSVSRCSSRVPRSIYPLLDVSCECKAMTLWSAALVAPAMVLVGGRVAGASI
jgi:hypothetical protein